MNHESQDDKKNPDQASFDTEAATSQEEADPAADQRRELRFESRLASAEAQILALQDGLAEIQMTRRAGKQRALVMRLGLLVILTGALFYMMAVRGVGG